MATFLLSEVVLRELLVQLTLGRSFLYFVKSFSSFPDFAKALQVTVLYAAFDPHILMLVVIILVWLGKPDRWISTFQERNVIATSQIAIPPVHHRYAEIRYVSSCCLLDKTRKLTRR